MASAMWQVLFFGRPWPGVEFNEKLLSEIFFDEDDWEIADERGAERLQEINFQTPHEALYKGVILKETMYEVIWKSDRGRGFFLAGAKVSPYCRGGSTLSQNHRCGFPEMGPQAT